VPGASFPGFRAALFILLDEHADGMTANLEPVIIDSASSSVATDTAKSTS
jgi:hypothetical protein